ncbi:MAG: hypothetical protein OHK0053_00460 [Microscillaceae bacterium]
MGKIFGSYYASVFLDRQAEVLKVVWRNYYSEAQYKMVMTLVHRQIQKHGFTLVIENQKNERPSKSQALMSKAGLE